MSKLNKRDLIELVAEKAHLSKRDATAAIEVSLDLIEKSLLKGDEVNLTNFGTFTPKVRRGRTGTHPKDHTLLQLEETKTVTFKLSKNLKEKINK